MADKELNLFDFGTNSSGEYVNLVEEEKHLKDISEQDFRKWLQDNENPLIKIAGDFLINYYDLETKTKKELQEELEQIAANKTYHYGNMEKGLYIFTLKSGSCRCFLFQNDNHIMVNLNYVYSEKELEQTLFGETKIIFNALSVRVYDLQGNRIERYGNKDKDIRYQCTINEWKMDKYGENRIHESQKINDFYEIALFLPKLSEYWGESNIE